jgi:hypothetical protein
MARVLMRRSISRCVSALVVVGAYLAVGVVPVTAEVSGAPKEALAQYRAWMVEARKVHPYPQSVDKMYRVMMCESTGNARAAGDRGTSLGLFQYKTGTWRGKWNPYRNNSIWDAKSQIYATAKAWSVGMQSHWTCYYKTAGR